MRSEAPAHMCEPHFPSKWMFDLSTFPDVIFYSKAPPAACEVCSSNMLFHLRPFQSFLLSYSRVCMFVSKFDSSADGIVVMNEQNCRLLSCRKTIYYLLMKASSQCESVVSVDDCFMPCTQLLIVLYVWIACPFHYSNVAMSMWFILSSTVLYDG